MADVWANSIACHPRATCRCRVLPLGEFTVMIPEPHATLQDAVTWLSQCHDRATLQGASAILKIVFRDILFFICFFFNAVWALTSGGFRIVSDTLVSAIFLIILYIVWYNSLSSQSHTNAV